MFLLDPQQLYNLARDRRLQDEILCSELMIGDEERKEVTKGQRQSRPIEVELRWSYVNVR